MTGVYVGIDTESVMMTRLFGHSKVYSHPLLGIAGGTQGLCSFDRNDGSKRITRKYLHSKRKLSTMAEVRRLERLTQS